MSFPEFEAGGSRVLWFSRGWGRGHAIPDIEIIRAWQSLRPTLQVRVVSYGLGAATFSEFGFSVIDVSVDRTSPIAELTVLAGRLTGWLAPELVVAHEEFPAMPVAKIFQKPSIFLTDFFADAAMYSMNALKFADEVLFLGQEGVFPEPPWLAGKVRYLGPVLREFRYGRGDQARARVELGIPADALVISVFPGSWDEQRAPLVDLMAAVFEQLDPGRRRIIWAAGSDRELVAARFEASGQATVFEHRWDIDRLMVASDVAITKANRITVFELCRLGVPSIALSFGLNPMDDQAVRGLEGVAFRPASGLVPADLVALVQNHAGAVTGGLPQLSSGVECAALLEAALARSEEARAAAR